MDPPPYDFNLEEFQRRWELEESLLKHQQRLLEELRTSRNQSRTRTHIERDHESAHQMLIKDYFVESPTYTDNQFRRIYHMQRPLILHIINSLSNFDMYFTQRRNNAGKRGLSTFQKCTAAIRMLAYGVATDACDEYVKIGETTALECLRRFCERVISIFENDYMRRPTAEDLQQVLHVGSEHRFLEMVGSIDCMHWQWKNCLKAWQGQFTSGHKGTLNDINVLHRSLVFNDIEGGEAPHVNFTINGHQYNLAYYLADGIYPK